MCVRVRVHVRVCLRVSSSRYKAPNSNVFLPLIKSCSIIWVAHVPFPQQHRWEAFKEFCSNLPSEMFSIKMETSWKHGPEVTVNRFPALTFPFTQLVSVPEDGAVDHCLLWPAEHQWAALNLKNKLHAGSRQCRGGNAGIRESSHF